jgi:hypothetical protein
VPVGIVPVGVYENGIVVHVDVLCAVMIAAGLTVTNSTNVVLPLLQLGAENVTV